MCGFAHFSSMSRAEIFAAAKYFWTKASLKNKTYSGAAESITGDVPGTIRSGLFCHGSPSPIRPSRGLSDPYLGPAGNNWVHVVLTSAIAHAEALSASLVVSQMARPALFAFNCQCAECSGHRQAAHPRQPTSTGGHFPFPPLSRILILNIAHENVCGGQRAVKVTDADGYLRCVSVTTWGFYCWLQVRMI